MYDDVGRNKCNVANGLLVQLFSIYSLGRQKFILEIKTTYNIGLPSNMVHYT